MNRQIYISGPITTDDNFVEKFQKAEEKLIHKGLFKKSEIFNPAKTNLSVILKPDAIDPDSLMSVYNKYMKYDLNLLFNCTHIYMLNGWTKSKGATAEWSVARSLGLEIIYDDECKKISLEDAREMIYNIYGEIIDD